MTIEELNDKVARLELQLAEAEQQLADRNKTIATYEKEIEAHQAAAQKSVSEAKELLDLNGELQGQLVTSEKNVASAALPTVKHEEKTYEFVRKTIRVDRKELTIADVKADKTIIKKLIDSGSNMLRLKETK